jgi:hypothetical protein
MRPWIYRLIPFGLAAVGFTATLLVYHNDWPTIIAAAPLEPSGVKLISVPPPNPDGITPAGADQAVVLKRANPERTLRVAAEAPPAPAAQNGLVTPDEVKQEREVPVDLRGQSGSAVIFNRSGEPLHVSLTATDSTTGATSRADLLLEGHERKNLLEAGFAAEPGSVISIHSAPYQDVIVRR